MIPISNVLLPCAACVLAAAGVAQGVVSPPELANRVGNSVNAFPFGDATRFVYQQIHTRLGPARRIGQLAVRSAGASSASKARAIDAELWIGNGSYANRGAVFAANFTGTPTRAIARRRINLPDWTKARSEPEPFDAVLKFDAPWAYANTADVCWQVVIHANTQRAAYWADAFAFSDRVTGRGTDVGRGCTVAGRTTAARLSGRVSGARSTRLWTLDWSAAWLPGQQPYAVLLGLGDPAASVPGLCAKLHTSRVFATLGGVTTARGTFATAPISTPFRPGLAGFTLHVQAAALEPGRPGIPVAVTNGSRIVVPDEPLPRLRHCRIFAKGSSTATSGTLADNSGLVVEFR